MDEDIAEERKSKNSCIQCGKELKESEQPSIEVKFGGQVFKVCSEECSNIFVVDMKKERKDNLEKAKIDLRMNERELAYKTAQLGTDILEKNESKLSNIRSFPKDDIKPKFVLENEIETIQFQIKKQRQKIKNMEETQKDD